LLHRDFQLEDKRSQKKGDNEQADKVARKDTSLDSGPAHISPDASAIDLETEMENTFSYEDEGPREIIPGFAEMKALDAVAASADIYLSEQVLLGTAKGNYVAYTIKLPADQLAALQSIWLELKRLYGTHSPDKSGMIQQAIQDWLKRWDGPDRQKLLNELLEIRQDTRRRQYKK